MGIPAVGKVLPIISPVVRVAATTADDLGLEAVLASLVLSVLETTPVKASGHHSIEHNDALEETSLKIRRHAQKLTSINNPRKKAGGGSSNTSSRLQKLSDSVQARISIMSSIFESNQVDKNSVIFQSINMK